MIDDRLPTLDGKLLYLKAEEDHEFWTPLLEKAFAKFYGSYQALQSGTAIEAAVDFTGGIPEYIDLSEIMSECALREKLLKIMNKDKEDKCIKIQDEDGILIQKEGIPLQEQAILERQDKEKNIFLNLLRAYEREAFLSCCVSVGRYG